MSVIADSMQIFIHQYSVDTSPERCCEGTFEACHRLLSESVSSDTGATVGDR